MDVVIVSNYTIHTTLVIILFIRFWQNLSSDICLWWRLTFRKGKLWKNPCHGIIPLSSRQNTLLENTFLGCFIRPSIKAKTDWIVQTPRRHQWDLDETLFPRRNREKTDRPPEALFLVRNPVKLWTKVGISCNADCGKILAKNGFDLSSNHAVARNQPIWAFKPTLKTAKKFCICIFPI